MTSRSILLSWLSLLGIATSFATLVIVSIASLWPAGEPGSAVDTTHVVENTTPIVDKILHVVAYAVTVLPLAVVKQNVVLRIALLALVWSGVVELLQPLVGRTTSATDLLFNAFGIGLGLVAVRLLKAVYGDN